MQVFRKRKTTVIVLLLPDMHTITDSIKSTPGICANEYMSPMTDAWLPNPMTLKK
jgi:hypothetical protein